MNRLIVTSLVLGLGVSVAMAQSDLLPNGNYPQFRTLSGLPGGGFGVRADGSPAFDGAMTFSTPIGYSLNHWHLSVGLANTSDTRAFQWIHTGGRSGSNTSLGKGEVMLGIPLGRFGSMTASLMIISSIFDRAFNVQYQFPWHYRGLAVSAGVQDIVGHRGSGAEGVPGGNGLSRSYFGAATYALPKGIYLSAGLGDRRFSRGFASISSPFANRWKAVLEHDGFNFNEGIAYDASAIRGLKFRNNAGHVTFMIGLVRSKYAYWSANISF